MVITMNQLIDDLLLHKNDRLSSIVVENHLWLNSVNDIIKYCESNPNAHSGQFVGVSTNHYKKIYILMQSNITFLDGVRFYPVCVNDIAATGALNFGGTYEVVSRVNTISGGLSIHLQNVEASHYKLSINGGYITSTYQPISEVFVTAPIIFSSDNEIKINLYNERNNEMEFITTMRFINSVTTNNISSGILTPMM